MSWNLKGRSAVAALDPSTRYQITHAHQMARCANKPLLWVLEELIGAEAVGGLSGRLRKVDYFICLIVRLLQICPPPAIILTMLRQDVHKYLRAAALVVIRLIGGAAMIREALLVGWGDYRKIRVYGNSSEDEGRMGDAVKRPRSDVTTTTTVADAGVADEDMLNNLISTAAPHFFIWRLDELTDRLFMAPRAASSDAAAADDRQRIGDCYEVRRFLGVPLPPLPPLTQNF